MTDFIVQATGDTNLSKLVVRTFPTGKMPQEYCLPISK